MISREDIRQLAEFESPDGCAVTFYYQPQTPQDKSHRGEAILVKDLVRDVLRGSERAGRDGAAKPDLDRILELSERLHGNHARAKAVFACSAKGVWREFDLPSKLPGTRLMVNKRFHLRPLSTMFEDMGRVVVLLTDREVARFFTLELEKINETEVIKNELSRRGRSDGWGGYDAGHAERHIDNEAMQHFKQVAERLKDIYERPGFRSLVIGCRDETWPMLEPHLHPYVSQRLIGRIAVDPRAASTEELRSETKRLLRDVRLNTREGLVREVVGEAHRNRRGAVGAKHVINALERGEVQTLLVGEDFSVPAVVCPNCAHVDIRMVKQCAVCAHETKEMEDLSDELIGRAMRQGIEIHYVSDAAFKKAGNIGALLRFRADQNTEEKKAS